MPTMRYGGGGYNNHRGGYNNHGGDYNHHRGGGGGGRGGYRGPKSHGYAPQHRGGGAGNDGAQRDARGSGNGATDPPTNREYENDMRASSSSYRGEMQP